MTRCSPLPPLLSLQAPRDLGLHPRLAALAKEEKTEPRKRRALARPGAPPLPPSQSPPSPSRGVCIVDTCSTGGRRGFPTQGAGT